jgi:hypothetical protein
MGIFDKCSVIRTDLEVFARRKELHPAFLFDTLVPFRSHEPHPDFDSQDTEEIGTPIPDRKVRTARSKKSESPPEAPTRNKIGRPAEYDWDGFVLEIIRIADSRDGLPDRQVDLVKRMLEWFGKTQGREPAESAVKKKISKIYNGLGKVRSSTG